MNIIEIISKTITYTGAHSYLEIGAAYGDTFLRIRAIRKSAVDPELHIKLRTKIKWSIKIPWNTTAMYYQTTSDDFFNKTKNNTKFDVIFIDGLHTYQQVLRDIENSLAVLSSKGVIIVHDCNPPNEVCAYPASSYQEFASLSLSECNSAWYGDVWKAIVFLRAFRNDMSVHVLNTDTGIGIITKKEPKDMLDLEGRDFDLFKYDDLASNRKLYLNLVDSEQLEGIVDLR